MSNTYSEKRAQELKEKLKQDFGLSNPGFWKEALKEKHVKSMHRVLDIAYEADKENRTLEKQRKQMVYEETQSVIEQRGRSAPPPIAGFLASTIGFPRSPAQEAELKVDANISRDKYLRAQNVRDQVFETLRLGEKYAKLKIDPERIKKNKERMIHTLKKQTYHADIARYQLRKAMHENNTEMVEIVRSGGENNPEQRLAEAFTLVMGMVDRAEENNLLHTFTKYNHVPMHKHAKQEAESLLHKHENSEVEARVQSSEQSLSQDFAQNQKHSHGQEH